MVKDATIVIPVHNDFEKFQRLMGQLVGNFEIIVIDTSERPVYQFPPSEMVYIHGFHYVLKGFVKSLRVCPSMVHELGLQYATAEPVIFLTPDTILKEGWLERFKTTGVL